MDILLVRKTMNNNNMVQVAEYIQIISPVIYGGALIVSILQFSAMKKVCPVKVYNRHMPAQRIFFLIISIAKNIYKCRRKVL